MTKTIRDLLPKKKGFLHPTHDLKAQGYNQALSEITAILEANEVRIVPSEERLFKLIFEHRGHNYFNFLSRSTIEDAMKLWPAVLDEAKAIRALMLREGK